MTGNRSENVRPAKLHPDPYACKLQQNSIWHHYTLSVRRSPACIPSNLPTGTWDRIINIKDIPRVRIPFSSSLDHLLQFYL